MTSKKAIVDALQREADKRTELSQGMRALFSSYWREVQVLQRDTYVEAGSPYGAGMEVARRWWAEQRFAHPKFYELQQRMWQVVLDDLKAEVLELFTEK